MGEFVTVGNASDVRDGEISLLKAAGRPIAVASVGGALYALDDTCTHRGCSLSEGELEGTSVVCPCHGGTFDLATGAVLDGPPPAPVGTYPIRVAGDGIMVEI